MKLTIRTSLCALMALGVPVLSFGITFNNTWDPTVKALSNASTFEADVMYAENLITSHFVDPITLNVTIAYSSSTGTLGESETSAYTGFTYAQVKGFLTAHATSPDQLEAVASLGATDPTGGGDFWIPVAEAELFGAPTVANAGTFIFGNQTYALDPNHRSVPGAYDFIGVATHELTEIMGRIPGITDGTGIYMPFDLYRYLAPGVRSFTPYAPAYFSINSGATDIHGFNTIPGADTQDWDGSNPNDSFNAFGSPGQAGLLTPGDYVAMEALGYTPLATPEPSTFVALAGGFGLLLIRRKRRS